VVRGDVVVTALRTAWSLSTLQEQTIIEIPAALDVTFATGFMRPSQKKTLFKNVLNY
jgi:hypothetical protein